MNIAITNYCNLKCPYCFANKFIESEKQSITEDQLDKILDFLFYSNLNKYKHKIGIIGGEPTLHPQFQDIINKIILFSKVNNFNMPVVFTNGILLKEYAKSFSDIQALININNPNIIGASKWNDFEKSLTLLDYYNTIDNINFGINLYHNMPDFSYIFEILKNFNKKYLRCSFVAPTKQNINKEEYYNSGKELFLNFIKEAEKNNILIHLDCNQIPLCYFNSKEIELIKKNINKRHETWCNPVIDFTPDFKAISCFGISQPIEVSQFDTYQELERYFMMKQIFPYTLKNNEGKCATCSKFRNFSCQGGCLGFVKK